MRQCIVITDTQILAGSYHFCYNTNFYHHSKCYYCPFCASVTFSYCDFSVFAQGKKARYSSKTVIVIIAIIMLYSFSPSKVQLDLIVLLLL